MDSDSLKLKKLEELFKLVNDSLTREEFVEAFKAVSEVVNERFEELAKEIRKQNRDVVSSTQQDYKDLKKETLDIIDHAIEIQHQGMNLVYDKLARLKDGKDGKKGDKGDRGERGPEGKQGKEGPRGKDGSPDTAEQVRDKLESLEGDARLDKSAIKGLKEELETIRKTPASVGVSDLRIRQAFKLILLTEEPTGVIDGANLSYTVSKPIFAVLSFSLNGETIAQLPNYTISGRTITFSTALPADYSGRDFEIKYIG